MKLMNLKKKTSIQNFKEKGDLMKNLKHIWLVVNKEGRRGKEETILTTCRTRKLARQITKIQKSAGRKCVARKFVSTS